MRGCRIALLALLGTCSAHAATCTWTGGGTDDNWSTAANWNNCGGAHATPVNGDALVFPSASPRPSPKNDITALVVQHVQVNGAGYSISGNAIQLSNGFTATIPSDTGAYFLPDITLISNAQSFLNNGTLPVLIGGTLDLNGQTLTVGGGANTNLSGNVVGAGHIIKNGAGTLFLEGTANAYTGATTINNGVVEAFQGSALGASGAGNMTTVTSGGSLLVEFGKTTPESLRLSGFGFNNNGALIGGFDNNHVTGDIVLAADASISNDVAGNSLTIDGAISGAFTLYKTGSGRVRLTNTNTHSATIISAGTLQVDGVNSAIEIDDNATLAGTGQCNGTMTLLSGGTIAPGAGGGTSAGTLSGKTLRWNGGGVLGFRLGASDAASDHLLLSQSFNNFSGVKHAFRFKDGATPPVVGTAYTLVEFATTNFSAVDFSFNYVGTGPSASMTGTFTLSATQLLFTPGSVNSDLIFRNGFDPGDP